MLKENFCRPAISPTSASMRTNYGSVHGTIYSPRAPACHRPEEAGAEAVQSDIAKMHRKARLVPCKLYIIGDQAPGHGRRTLVADDTCVELSKRHLVPPRDEQTIGRAMRPARGGNQDDGGPEEMSGARTSPERGRHLEGAEDNACKNCARTSDYVCEARPPTGASASRCGSTRDRCFPRPASPSPTSQRERKEGNKSC